jgi:septum site-determining protein MinC
VRAATGESGHGVNESQARLPRIVVRGTRDGLVIVLPERGTSREIVQALAQRIAGAEGFFRGAEVVLDYGTRAVIDEEVAVLRQVLEERGITLRTATATGFDSRSALRALGFSPLSAMPQPPVRGDEAQHVPVMPRDELPTRYVRRTFRSGMSLHHPGHLTVLGDINPGAELTAAGDIVVFGSVRGVVHAGAAGDSTAIIAALSLTPTQLRIGNVYGRPPDAHGDDPNAAASDGPCIAHLDGGEMIIVPWYGGRDVPPVR